MLNATFVVAFTRNTKSQNFPVGRISRAKTFQTECVNCFHDKNVPKVRQKCVNSFCDISAEICPHITPAPQHLLTVSYLISPKRQLFKNIAHDGSHKSPKPATRWRSHWYFLKTALYVLIELHLCSEAIPV